jgi:hypothetical protein
MADDQKKAAPPYASFSSLVNFLNMLRETTIPSRIDPSVFGNASGSTSYSIIAALKSLKLIDAHGVPSAQFTTLVCADDAARKPLFKQILRSGYPHLFDGKIDLTTVTAGHFDDLIRKEYDVKGSTVDKVAGFFISAAVLAGEPISPHLKARRAIAGSQTSRKSSKQRRQDSDAPPPPKDDTVYDKSSGNKPLEYMLIDLMAEPDIEDDVRQSIWSLVQYLAKRKAKPKAGP